MMTQIDAQIGTRIDAQAQVFQVVHPLYDVSEEKFSPENLGAMHMTLMVRLSLFALRGYLILIILLVFYSVLHQAGAFGL